MGVEKKVITRRQALITGGALAASLFLPTSLAAASAEKRPLKVTFVHGWLGQGTYSRDRDETWVDSIKDYCRDNGIPHVYPNFEGGATPDARVWMRQIRHEVLEADKEGRDTLLLAYSLGARAALLFADTCLKNEDGFTSEMLEKVKALVLVAPFNNDTANASRRGGAYANFFDYKVDTEAITKAIPVRRVLHSPNDHQVPYSQGVEIATALNAPLVSPDNRRHFNEKEDGAVVLEVLDEALRALKQS